MQDSDRDKQLHDAWERAKKYSGDTSVSSLRHLCCSDDSDTRILGLLLIRARIDAGELFSEYFEIARQRIEDPNNTCRWQSILVIEEFIESDPDAVWEVASQYGESDDEDMRVAIGVNLLETLFEHDFDTYFPRVSRIIQD
ncbi:MAG: hypothetical protein O7G85_15140 [Planctomycetota bacterium]|nr:hypothetical protein [Planctomycetota bacterium]